MTVKQEYPHLPGRQVIHDGVSNATGGLTLYSDKFNVGAVPIWSTHFEWVDDAADYESLITLWASDHAAPDEANDADWVEMESEHGFPGLPKGNPPGGTGKDLADVGNSGSIWYRWKIARTAGSAVIQAFMGGKASVGRAP